VDGADLGDAASAEELIGTHLKALPANTDTGSGPSAGLTVVIDQLDESPFILQLAQWLRRCLARRDVRNLRVWVACRTAEYPAGLTKVLEDSLGSCTVGDLAPLTRDETVELVTSGGDDAVFLDAVMASAVGVLASIPLTLMVLLSAYGEDPDSLRDEPRRIFELGMTALADEHDDDRTRAWSATTVEQRVAIAARIATHLLLSGRRAIHTRWVGNQSDEAIPLGELVGASEVAGAGKFEVTKAMVEETLATALFSRTAGGTAVFAHSSFAAFLAARHLAARVRAVVPIPQRQLAGVFLVSAPDEDTAAIPEHLRETAAWLLAHCPEDAEWLAAADPEGLVAHTGVLTSPMLRALLVDGLLRRADRIELSDRSWQRARWQLTHPGFAAQLSDVLTSLADARTDEWTDFARARLAVRLAHDASLPDLTEPLLAVVEDPRWSVVIRLRAVKAAMNASTALAAPRLRALLAELAPGIAGKPAAATAEHDGNDQDRLVATVLQVLWPDHLPLREVLPHIRPVNALTADGNYWAQVHDFPRHVADPDLPALITFAEETLRTHGVVLNQPDPDEAHEETDADSTTVAVPLDYFSHEHIGDLKSFTVPIIDRVLASSTAGSYLTRIARILLWFLPTSTRIPLPKPADLVNDDDGRECETTTQLRRNLAEALIITSYDSSISDRHTYWLYLINSRWGNPGYGTERDVPPGTRRARRTTLLDANDTDWAVQRAERHQIAGNTDLADMLTTVAHHLATPGPDPDTVDEGDDTWEQADAFAAEQRRNLDLAADGDTDAFWRLAKFLSSNPRTGRRERISSWNATDYPGAVLWSKEDLDARLRVAAHRYVRNEHDHRQDWLGTNTTDWRAYAGYLALASLYTRERPANAPSGEKIAFVDLPGERWAAWVGAIIQYTDSFASPLTELDRFLLDQAVQHAQTELATALEQYVRTIVSHANVPLRLPSLPLPLVPTLTKLAVELDTALRIPPTQTTSAGETTRTPILDEPITVDPHSTDHPNVAETWADLLYQPLRAADNTATELALTAITNRSHHPFPDIGEAMAVAAARTLLVTDAVQHWPTIYSVIATSPDFGRDLAFGCVAYERTREITESLDEAALTQAYRWLTTVSPPETETHTSGWREATPDHEVHDWCREVVAALARHATAEAVNCLRGLVADFPARLDLQAALLDTRRGVQAKAATQLTSSQVTALLNDNTRRVVRTAAQLAEVVTDTLDAVAADLHTHSNLLWNCERLPRPDNTPPGTHRQLRWRPKLEGALGSYLAHELRLRLGRNRVVVNREVVVHPTNEGDAGERPDILIEAGSPDNHTTEGPVIRIPLEIKGAWHDDVQTAQATQLAHYIHDLNTTTGVYVVGWYPLEHWDATDDSKRDDARRHRPVDNLSALLQKQAEDIQQTGTRTYPYVLTIPRQAKRDKPAK
jgi:hypothetical protein